ncbi:MAG: ATP-dependent DNA helicase RecG [Deltaproteobacteria bacterium]|nr:ATP-dependent DNA helicase RecG [Deltaproteobacteria bacterium]
MADGFAGVLLPEVFAAIERAWPPFAATLTDASQRERVAEALAAWPHQGRQDRAQLVARLARMAAEQAQQGATAPSKSKPARAKASRSLGRRGAAAAPAADDAVATSSGAATTLDVRDLGVETLAGVGPATAAKLRARGLSTLEDLVLVLPAGYIDLRSDRPPSTWRDGEVITFVANVRGLRQGFARGRFGATMELERVADGERISARWFAPVGGLAQWAQRGEVRVVGAARMVQGRWSLAHPQLRDPTQPLPKIAARYPAVEGVPAASFARLVRAALARLREVGVPDPLPVSLREAQGLPSLGEALAMLHEPGDAIDDDALASLQRGSSPGHRRLAFDEFFYVQLALGLERARYQDAATAVSVHDDAAVRARCDAALPFRMTAAQRRVADELLADMAGARPMMRLVQGDVGSGKTAVAFAAALAVAAAGGQSAIMAPTEILAEQHLRTLQPWCERAGLSIGLVTGALKGGVRESRVALAAAGAIDVLVGTHALLTSDVGFARLGLVVIDEQHRFGVEQRAALRSKGERPHLLVMTATPIPRSMALVAYGELDLSVIDELPPGREPAATEILLGPRALAGARARIAACVREGAQAFVVCPLVEASDAIDVSDVEAAAAALRALLPGHEVGVIHGRMPSRDKDAIMRAFAAGALTVLVATTVIEVGVDVPSAKAILVEHAERFGLAQLHQLRGRVGRGGGTARCIIHSAATTGSEIAARLQVLVDHHDGFAVADADLALRGPGEVFGTKQAGSPRLRTALRGSDTVAWLVDARRAAADAIARAPAPEQAPWAAELARRAAAGLFGEA